MSRDRWPDEPEDPYADAREDPGAAPEADLVPEIPDATAADPELARTFWSLVAMFNVGLFAVSVGVLVIAFRGQWTLGGAALSIGLGALAIGWYGYRHRNV